MMQSRPASGGAFSISSCHTIYNKLSKSRPDLLEVLAKDNWALERYVIVSFERMWLTCCSQSSLIPSQRRPLLFYHEDHLMMDFARQMLLGRQGLPWTQGLAGISAKQLEALNMVESIAQASRLTLSMEPGDITFINNHAVLHSRSAFEDTTQHVRHLFRLWLRNEELAWKLPPPLDAGNARLYGTVEPPETWELTPMPQFPIPWNQWSTSP